MQNTDETFIEYPCQFPIKAMGLRTPEFVQIVFEIVQGHVPEIQESALHKRESSNGKYLSVTITIEARSREQLDAIYMDLSAHQLVLMAL